MNMHYVSIPGLIGEMRHDTTVLHHTVSSRFLADFCADQMCVKVIS